MDQKCGNCRFWKGHKVYGEDRPSVGHCRRYPPPLSKVHDDVGVDLVADFPLTACIDWCGEWQSTEPSVGEPIPIPDPRKVVSPRDHA